MRQQEILDTYLSYIHSWIYAAADVHNNVCSEVLSTKFKCTLLREMQRVEALERNVG